MDRSKLQACIDICQQCHATCTSTMQYCISQGGRHVEQDHLRLMMDCAQICATSADFMLRGSPLHEHTCAACAAVCRACAQSCATMGDDATMKKCADDCDRCARSCREMSSGDGRGARAA